MNPTWISQRLSLSGLPLRLDADGERTGVAVLPRESLAVVRSAADVVGAARRACAGRLRAAREREREHRRRERAAASTRAAEAERDITRRALIEAARIASSLKEEREQLLAAAEPLMARIAQEAARRLLLELPSDVVAGASARLLHHEWLALRGEGDAHLSAHPEDLPTLGSLAAEAAWVLVADPTLARGHCVLTHPAGSLHAHFGENVQALIAALDAGSASAPDPLTFNPPEDTTP